MFNHQNNHFRNNLLCLDFIDSSQNHCSFHHSHAKIIQFLGNTCKEIVCIIYQSRGKICKSSECKISMNTSINDDQIIMYFSNWSKKFIFHQFSR